VGLYFQTSAYENNKGNTGRSLHPQGASHIVPYLCISHLCYAKNKHVFEKRSMGYKNSLWAAAVRRTLQKYVFNLDKNLSSGN